MLGCITGSFKKPLGFVMSIRTVPVELAGRATRRHASVRTDRLVILRSLRLPS